MPSNRIGELRRSQVLSTFGPGAIVDFRAGGGGGAPISAVISGLEGWDDYFQPPGINNPQTVFEPRLQNRLGVQGFRLPPVTAEDDESSSHLPAVRFPTWLQCPQCDLIRPFGRWRHDPGDPARYCGRCSTAAGRVNVIPVRFVAVCRHGHIEDFPWTQWIRDRHAADCGRTGDLVLRTYGAGLAGLRVVCTDCGGSRSLDGAFASEALSEIGVRCSGSTPWLPTNEDGCGEPLRTTQRGASNMYFPIMHSALAIPPWSDRLQQYLGVVWAYIMAAEDAGGRRNALEMANGAGQLEGIGLDIDQLSSMIEERIGLLDNEGRQDLRQEEYLQFRSGVTDDSEHAEFEIRPEPVEDNFGGLLSDLVRAVRLREVRAVSGFTRLEPPEGEDEEGGSQPAPLSREPKNWLPAIEVRGEGIFIALDEDRLRDWERRQSVIDRVNEIRTGYVDSWQQRFGNGSTPDTDVHPRLLLLHTLAHALMRRLSLDCGYSSASLRERLYAGTAENPMSGLLIYTAAPDSDGTLGGLVRQGHPDRFAEILEGAIRDMQWCSSDPLCIQGHMSASDVHNSAACHACVLAPETSCELFNRFLDRALLVGTPDNASAGFFSSLL